MVNAGFIDVAVSSIPTVQRLPSAAAATAMIREGFAFYRAMIAHLSKEQQGAAWTELEQTLKCFEGAGGFVGPGELNLVVGCKP